MAARSACSEPSRTGEIPRHLARSVLAPCSVALAIAACGGTFVPRELPPPHRRANASVGSPQNNDSSASTPASDLPDPALVEDVTLDDLLAFADAKSPVLRAARSTRSRVVAAHAAAAVALPSNLTLSGSVGPRIGEAGTGVDVEVSLMQQLWIAGEQSLRADAADALGELTEAEIEALRWDVHCDVHLAYHHAIVARERVLFAEGILKFQEDVAGAITKQASAGEIAPLSLRLTQAEVAQAKQAAVGAKQSLLAARIQLARLSGWPPSRPPMPIGALDAARDPPPASELAARAQKMPRLRAREAAVAEAQARLAVAERDVAPEPSIGVGYRREGNPTDEGAYHIILGMVTVPIPTFDTNQAERAAALADASVARADLESTSSVLAADLELGRSEVVAAAARVRTFSTEVIPRFQENLELLGKAFALGELDLLQVTAARERFLRIQSDALDSHLAYFVAVAALERQVGADLFRDTDHGGAASAEPAGER